MGANAQNGMQRKIKIRVIKELKNIKTHKNFVEIKIYVLLPSLNQAKVAQLVEHDLAKVGVASSNLVFRSKLNPSSEGIFFEYVYQF